MALDINKVNKNHKPSVDDDADFDLDFEPDELDGEEDDDLGEQLKPPKSVKKKSEGLDKKTKYIIGGACGVVVIAISIVIATTISSRNKQKESQQQLAELQQQQSLEQASKQQQQTTTTPSNVKAGAPNLQVDNNKVNDTPISDEGMITSDLNGNEVSANYKIKSIDTVRDFINFTKYRAQTADGMEFYWLEVTYKEKPYKVQIPYKIFKELDASGITVADIEVTKVDKGGGQSGEIVTYMNIVENSKKLINKDK